MRVLLLTVSTPAEVQDLSSTLLLCDKSIIITIFSVRRAVGGIMHLNIPNHI